MPFCLSEVLKCQVCSHFFQSYLHSKRCLSEFAQCGGMKFYFDESQPLLICRTLKYFEDVLTGHRFLRIHRSYLINPDFVVRYSKGKGGYVTMKNNQELEISPNKKKEFLDLFEG